MELDLGQACCVSRPCACVKNHELPKAAVGPPAYVWRPRQPHESNSASSACGVHCETRLHEAIYSRGTSTTNREPCSPHGRNAMARQLIPLATPGTVEVPADTAPTHRCLRQHGKHSDSRGVAFLMTGGAAHDVTLAPCVRSSRSCPCLVSAGKGTNRLCSGPPWPWQDPPWLLLACSLVQ